MRSTQVDLSELQDDLLEIQNNTSTTEPDMSNSDLSNCAFERKETGSRVDIKGLGSELEDLGTWLKLDLDPKEILEKHVEEMKELKEKIEKYKEELKKLNVSAIQETE